MELPTALARMRQALPLYIPVILIAAVGAAITAFDAVFMAEGAAAMAPNAEGGALLAGVAVCAAVFKAGWMAAFRTFLQRYNIMLAAAVLAFGLLTHVFSITATIGIAATGRDAVISDRSEARERHSRALTAYDAAKARKASLPATRPVPQIRADLSAIQIEIDEQARREAAERKSGCHDRCQKAVRKGEAAKQERNRLEAELATALEAKKASADFADAQAALDAIAAPGNEDPQAAAIAAYVPAASFTEREAALLLPLLPSLIVEIGGPVCFLIAGAFLSIARERMDAPKPSSTPVVAIQTAPTDLIEDKTSERSARPVTIWRTSKAQTPLLPTMARNEIAAIRSALGESQEAFAARFGVSARTLRRWETGERPVSRKAALRARVIADEFRRQAIGATYEQEGK